MGVYRGSVLVVDDEEINVAVLSGYLQANGYEISTALSGQAALDAVAQTEFDAVLLDVMMPGIGGYEVLKQIRTAYSQIELPVIMVTALNNSEDIVRALGLGANDYVRKPVDKSVMLARLHNHIALKNAVVAKAKADRETRESQTRLQLLHGISSARTSSVSILEVISNTVQQIFAYFPQYRISYKTFEQNKHMKIWYSEAPEDMPRLEGFSGDMLDAPDYTQALFAREPIVVGDISKDNRTLPLMDVFVENGTQAILDIPFLHSKDVIGLLSFAARAPNAWSEHEIYTLTGVVEYLSLAIADAHSQDERQRAEESLQFQNALLHAQQEATIDGVLVVDENRKWVSFNQPFVDMWHIPADVVEKRDSETALQVVVKNLIDPDEFLDRVHYLYGHQSEKSREEIELVDGRIFDRYSTPMFGSKGQYYGRVWYFRDVTDYKDIEEALRNANDELEQRVAMRTAELRESEERFLQLAENIHEAFYVVSMPERKILYMSPAFETIWGIPCQKVYEDPTAFEQTVFEEDRAKLKAVFQQESEGMATQIEYRIVCANGDVRWIWDQAFPVYNEAGEIYRVVGIAEDMTEQKLLSEQFFQAQKMDAVGKLAGGVAHDFNNLLTVINGYSKLGLRKLGEKDPLRDNLNEIHKAGERAQGLTSQLLAFSRKQMLQPQVLDVNMLVANLQKMLHRLIGEDIELSATMRAQSQIEADPIQLEQVIMNLVVNARDAMPKGGRLSIKTSDVILDGVSAQHCQVVAGAYVCLSVTDTGCGMDEETQMHIFDPFFTTKEHGKGTGLGLSTVYGIVTQSDGGLVVESVLGQGATFRVYLPCYQGDSDADVSDINPSEIVRGHGTVLVAEDEDMVRLLTVAVLQESGYRVLDARSGEDACVLFERHKDEVDLLVTDIVMPQMSGKDLADRLCALNPNLKVLYVSGYTGDVIGNHGILEPDVAFLQKPFMPEELSEMVHEILEDKY